MKRVFLIVLDSLGIGAMPDAGMFGDVGVNTLGSISKSQYFHIPNLEKMGIFSIDGENKRTTAHEALIARMEESSKGKDTTIGHWEIAGVVSGKPLPTYPQGFPEEVLTEFTSLTQRGILCNQTYSGTQVIADYGREHCETGKLIVYTSADSVFQIAAHEQIVPVETLYDYCRIARKILQGEHGVGRVIARPFTGPIPDGPFVRTTGRHDYSLLPPRDTMLDIIKNSGQDVIAVGKINDIFAGQGITEYVYTTGNEDGINKTLEYMDRDFQGICFTNLVDYDMLYGHRRDVDGYAKALSYFDERLPEIIGKLREDDVLMLTGDHGCDPAYDKTTDHTREYTPFIMYGKNIAPKNMGTRKTFADIGATVLQYLGIASSTDGKSML